MRSQSETTPVTYTEIVTQPLAWEQALERVANQATSLIETWNAASYDHVLFTGCGSTYYLSLAAAALFQQITGTSARGVPASELLLYPQTAYTSGATLLIAVSRSGETTETIQAVKAFCAARTGSVVVITNDGQSPLANLGSLTLNIPAGQEKSIAQTRSFASMYCAATAMAATIAADSDALAAMNDLPAVGERLIHDYQDLAQELGSDLDLDRIYYLGSGPRYGLACEANLKMKEMTLTHSEPFHFLEFRHGPKSMVGSSALVVGLLSDHNRTREAVVLDEMRQLGGRTLALAESEADVAFQSQVPSAVRNVLYLPVLQLMSYYRAIAKGLNPDAPANLDAVVKLSWEV
jgi:glucosamine--fructose-6-phosphate aminotransferase (isomerizing)